MLNTKPLKYYVILVLPLLIKGSSRLIASDNVPSRETNNLIHGIDILPSTSRELYLVEVKKENPNIIVDMKYTTAENCAGKPVSAETKCLVSKRVMDKLNNVQAELEKQGLGLKVFDGFRPLYVEIALMREGKNYFCSSKGFNLFCEKLGLIPTYEDPYEKFMKLSYSEIPCAEPEMPMSNQGAMVAVTLVTRDGKELEMPTGFDDRSSKAYCNNNNIPQQAIAHRDILTRTMIKHGFEQSIYRWYEFYDEKAYDYPQLLHTNFITASVLNEQQEKDHFIITSEIVNSFNIEQEMLMRLHWLLGLIEDDVVATEAFFPARVEQIDKNSTLPQEFQLVEVNQENPKIIIDMKYTTAENCAEKPISSETKCLVSRRIMNKLNKVQAELEKQGLGLKVFDGFRPLYVEVARLRALKRHDDIPADFVQLCHILHLISLPREQATSIRKCWTCHLPEMPRGNKGAQVAVTLVTADGKEIAMPTNFDDYSDRTHPDYNDLPHEVLAHRQLLKNSMLKHGFKQTNVWYEFYDEQVDEYPQYSNIFHTVLDQEFPYEDWQPNLRMLKDWVISSAINLLVTDCENRAAVYHEEQNYS